MQQHWCRPRRRRSARYLRATRSPRVCRSARQTGRQPHLGAHRAGREGLRLQLLGCHARQLALLRLAPIEIDAIDIGGDDEQIGLHLARQQLARKIFVDHRLDADQRARACPAGTWSGCRRRRRRSRSCFCSSSHLIGRISKIRLGSGEGTTLRHLFPSCLKTQLFLRPACRLPLCHRPGRRTWSGSGRPGRWDRPRPWSGWWQTAPRRAAGCPAPARSCSRSCPRSARPARRAGRLPHLYRPRPAVPADPPAGRCHAQSRAGALWRAAPGPAPPSCTFVRCTSAVIGSPRLSRALPPKATTIRIVLFLSQFGLAGWGCGAGRSRAPTPHTSRADLFMLSDQRTASLGGVGGSSSGARRCTLMPANP